MISARRSLLLLLLGALSLGACASPLVLSDNPAVRFTEPKGAVLYVRAGRGALRAPFNGKLRTAPVMCEENLAQVDTAKGGPSLRVTLTAFASRPGSAPIQIHGPDGKLLGKGRLCIFPLLRTPDLEVKKSYTIQVPLRVFQQTKQGLPAVIYEAYTPEASDGPGWKHIAWVIWFAPDL